MFESKAFKPQAPTLHQYLAMRQECRTFKSVGSMPCGWFLLVLAKRARGASLTKPLGYKPTLFPIASRLQT